MKLVILVGDLAKFRLTESEAIEEQRLMEQVRLAQMEALFNGNVKCLHELKYKRDIQLKSGTKLLGAWCKNITRTDNGYYVADFCFDRVLNKEDSAVETVMNWDYHPGNIDNEVDSKPFNKHEKELLKKCKFSIRRTLNNG